MQPSRNVESKFHSDAALSTLISKFQPCAVEVPANFCPLLVKTSVSFTPFPTTYPISNVPLPEEEAGTL
jgi:hypothetical protein